MKGKALVVRSGSSGNALYLERFGTRVLIDVGVGRSVIAKGLRTINRTTEFISAIVITHNHSDHISGLNSFRDQQVVFAPSEVLLKMNHAVHDFRPSRKFSIGLFFFEAFEVKHDVPTFGYKVSIADKKILYLTDCGEIPKGVVGFAKQADVIFLESNHCTEMLAASSYSLTLKDRISEGHLNNGQAAEFIGKVAKPGSKIVLMHLSRECNSPELAINSVRQAVSHTECSFVAVPHGQGIEAFDF